MVTDLSSIGMQEVSNQSFKTSIVESRWFEDGRFKTRVVICGNLEPNIMRLIFNDILSWRTACGKTTSYSKLDISIAFSINTLPESRVIPCSYGQSPSESI
eukprot:433504-Amphidinium_carterae.3